MLTPMIVMKNDKRSHTPTGGYKYSYPNVMNKRMVSVIICNIPILNTVINRSRFCLFPGGTHPQKQSLELSLPLADMLLIIDSLKLFNYDYFDYDYRDNAVAPIVDHDIYLSVRVLQSKSDDLIKTIIGMGYACKAIDLA